MYDVIGNIQHWKHVIVGSRTDHREAFVCLQ